MNHYIVILNLLMFAEKVLVFHWKSNSLFGTYIIENVDLFERLLDLGDNQDKLAVQLFNK